MRAKCSADKHSRNLQHADGRLFGGAFVRAYCFCHLNLTPWLCVLVQKIGASESTAAALSALMPLAGEGSSVLLASYIVSRHMPWRHVLSAGVPSTLLTGWGIDKLPHRWRGFVVPAWISLLVLGTLIMAADSRPRCDLLPPPLTCYLPAYHGDSSFCLCACAASESRGFACLSSDSACWDRILCCQVLSHWR